ncbi:MAG: glycosyltransferase [Chloroflexota bacterium]
MDKPAVSIIIPTYNSARYLPLALASVFEQDFSDYEVIVVDDGSTDETTQALRPFTPRIQYHYQQNAGSAAARNTGLARARGEFILFLDADDLLLPGKLRDQVAFLQQRPTLGLVHSGWRLIDEQGALIREVTPWQQSPTLDLRTWLHHKPVQMGAMLFRQVWLQRVDGLDPDLRQSHDVDLLLRLALAGCTAAWLKRPTLCYRVHSASTMRHNAPTQAASLVQLLDKFFAQPQLPPDIKQEEASTRYYTLLWAAWHLYRAGFADESRHYLQQSQCCSPHNSPVQAVCDWAYHFLKWQKEEDEALSLPWPWLLWQQTADLDVPTWLLLARLLHWWGQHYSLFSEQYSGGPFTQPASAWSLWEKITSQPVAPEQPAPEQVMDWWAAVWRPYLEQRAETAVANLITHFNHLAAADLVHLMQQAVLLEPSRATPALLAQIWQDARTAALHDAPLSMAAPAYLTLLGQQVLARQWRLAAATWLRLAQLGPGKPVWRAWRDFMQAGWHYWRGHTPRPPLVSVIIPAYNCAAYIAQTVDSVLAQTYAHCEIIVVDDGSTDETAHVLAPYNGRIHLARQQNQGVSAARNHGLCLAQGDYLLFLDADDLLLPPKLAQQVTILEHQPHLGAVHSGWRLIDEQGHFLQEVTPWHSAPRLDLEAWLRWKPAFLGAILFRRSWLGQTTGFDESLRQAEDVDLLLRLSLKGCMFVWLRQATVCYRQHGASTMRNGLLQAQSITAVLDSFFDRPHLPRRIRQYQDQIYYHTLMWVIWQLYRTGYRDQLAPYLRRTLPFLPAAPDVVVQNWLHQLAFHAGRDGIEIDRLRSFWPYMETAVATDKTTWQQIQQRLDWWLDVWHYYQNQQPELALSHLAQRRHLSARDLIALAQYGLTLTPRPTTTSHVRDFLAGLVDNKLLPADAHAEATALYLTLFGQSTLARRWQTAVTALLHALGRGWRPAAWPAWGRFVRSGWRYYSGQSLVHN